MLRGLGGSAPPLQFGGNRPQYIFGKTCLGEINIMTARKLSGENTDD